jgi:hypothetical protein
MVVAATGIAVGAAGVVAGIVAATAVLAGAASLAGEFVSAHKAISPTIIPAQTNMTRGFFMVRFGLDYGADFGFWQEIHFAGAACGSGVGATRLLR